MSVWRWLSSFFSRLATKTEEKRLCGQLAELCHRTYRDKSHIMCFIRPEVSVYSFFIGENDTHLFTLNVHVNPKGFDYLYDIQYNGKGYNTPACLIKRDYPIDVGTMPYHATRFNFKEDNLLDLLKSDLEAYLESPW